MTDIVASHLHIGLIHMYSVISYWTTSADYTEEMKQVVQETVVPSLINLGAQQVYCVQSDAESVQAVVTIFSSEAAAAAARLAQEELRTEASSTMPVTFQSEIRGAVFASGQTKAN